MKHNAKHNVKHKKHDAKKSGGKPDQGKLGNKLKELMKKSAKPVEDKSKKKPHGKDFSKKPAHGGKHESTSMGKKPAQQVFSKKSDIKKPMDIKSAVKGLKFDPKKVEVKKADGKKEEAKKVIPVKLSAKDVIKGLKNSESVKNLKSKSAVKEDAAKSKKVKKNDEVDDLDTDLLDDDEVLGSEEIPDLAEFEDIEEVEEEIEVKSWTSDEKPSVKGDDEIVLTDAEGRRYCRVKDCDQIATVDAYCRYHYLLFWKKIQVRKKILADGKLERYVEELTSRYPDKFLEMIRKDLRSEKDFLAAIAELEIDDSGSDSEFEDEAQNYIDEVRGLSTSTGESIEEDDY